MKSNRTITLFTIAAIMVCLALIGLPWQSPSTFGNFSGKLVYNTSEGTLDLNGRCNLYNWNHDGGAIQLKVICNEDVHEVSVNPELGTFSAQLDLDRANAGQVVALLEIDGHVVAQGTIDLPASLQNRVHIIRFSSLS